MTDIKSKQRKSILRIEKTKRKQKEKVMKMNENIRLIAAAGYYLDALTVSRCLERLGDLVTNIAEDVIYLETAEIVRHEPPR